MSLTRLGWIALVIGSFFYLLVLQVQAVWAFTIDDMYITLRYAKHWATGLGLLWNVGESPVEGYSNFSFLLLGRFAYFLNVNPVLMLKGVGVLGLWVLTAALFFLSRLWVGVRVALIPCVWLLAYRGQILWSVSGLETPVYEALVVFSVYFILRGLGFRAYPLERSEYRIRWFAVAGVCLAVAGMTRPEALALMVLFLGLLAVHGRGASWSGFAVFSGVLALCFLPYFIWRWHYFGRLFPNPVYCKGLVDPWNFDLDRAYLCLAWPFMVCALMAAWRQRRQGFDFLVWPSVVYLVLCVGADPVVAFYNRLFLPVFALLLPLALKGIMHVVVREWLVYVLSLLMIFLFIPTLSLVGYRHFTENPQSGEQLRERVLTWLLHHTSPGERVVLGDSGLIPYQSSLRFTDSYCLNNAAMTIGPREGMYMRFCQQALLSKPNVIILTALVVDGVAQYTPADACLVEQLKPPSLYCMQAAFSSQEHTLSYYRYTIYTAC